MLRKTVDDSTAILSEVMRPLHANHYVIFFQAEDGIRDWSVTGSSDVCSSDRSEEHTSELQSLTNLVCRRSEEHTSELQSLTNLVCRLLLEKTNKHRP